jgi:hypothetical protein
MVHFATLFGASVMYEAQMRQAQNEFSRAMFASTRAVTKTFIDLVDLQAKTCIFVSQIWADALRVPALSLNSIF